VGEAVEDLELGPALEVDQQQLELFRFLVGEQADQELAQECRLAGAGLATDEQVGRVARSVQSGPRVEAPMLETSSPRGGR
jgi:hypothetical protein